MAQARENHPPDVVGLTLEEAQEALAGWTVEAVLTAPPGRGRPVFRSDRSEGPDRSHEVEAEQRPPISPDARVLRQAFREGGAVVLTVAADGASGGKGPWGDANKR